MLELRAFVKQSLVEIAQAIADARPEVAALGGTVVPVALFGGGTATAVRDAHDRPVTTIEFDLAVTATAESGTRGGIGVVAVWLKVDAGADEREIGSTVSRIKFSVPMVLP